MKGVLVAVWAVTVWAVCELGVIGAKTTYFSHVKNTLGQGNVVARLNVKTRLQCSAACAAKRCDGYNLEYVAGRLSCTLIGSATGIVGASDKGFYGAGVVFLGGECATSKQCFLATPFAKCTQARCRCPSDMYQDGDRCKYDFRSSGFSVQNNRLVHIRPGSTATTWDLALQYCRRRYATMFIPRSSFEWSWMMSKITSSDRGCFLPINDKEVEGKLVWNDGRSIDGDNFVIWSLGIVGMLNSGTSDCTGVLKVAFLRPEAIMGSCSLVIEYVTICEANPDAR